MRIARCVNCGAEQETENNVMLIMDFDWKYRQVEGYYDKRLVCPKCAEILPRPHSLGKSYSWGT